MTYTWFDVTRNAGIARFMHMSYRSKTYTWNDVILVKRSMIRVFFTWPPLTTFPLSLKKDSSLSNNEHVHYRVHKSEPAEASL